MAYWIMSLSLIGFGFLGILSVGRPFLLAGLALLVLGPVRKRPALFWPPLAAVVAWNVAFLTIAPGMCTATQTIGTMPSDGSGESTTVCSNLLGMIYRGSGIYNPSLEPANQAALVVEVLTSVVLPAVILWTHRTGRVGPTPGDSV